MKAPKRPSTYRGVRWSRGQCAAQINVDGRQQSLGTFDDDEEAARAFDEKSKRVNDNPILNFLPDGSLNHDYKPRYKESRSKQTIDASVTLLGLLVVVPGCLLLRVMGAEMLQMAVHAYHYLPSAVMPRHSSVGGWAFECFHQQPPSAGGD